MRTNYEKYGVLVVCFILKGNYNTGAVKK